MNIDLSIKEVGAHTFVVTLRIPTTEGLIKLLRFLLKSRL